MAKAMSVVGGIKRRSVSGQRGLTVGLGYVIVRIKRCNLAFMHCMGLVICLVRIGITAFIRHSLVRGYPLLTQVVGPSAVLSGFLGVWLCVP
jgi:hypothetical protein